MKYCLACVAVLLCQAQERPAATVLPDEFTVDLSLETPINSDSAAVGNPVTAVLKDSIKPDKVTLVPKGAKLTGEITEFDHKDGKYTIKLVFTSMDWPEGHADFQGRTTEVFMMVTTRLATPYSSVQGTPIEQVSDVASPLEFKTKHLKLNRGFRLKLRSIKAP